MRRRQLITLLGGAAAWPLTARAQQGERVRRIGVVVVTKETDPETPLRAMAFRQALAKLGWSEGRNVVIDFRFGTGGDLNRMRAQAKELIGLTPDVIVAESTPAAVALHQETAAVPIVLRDARCRHLQSRDAFRPILAVDGSGCAIFGRAVQSSSGSRRRRDRERRGRFGA